MAKPNSSKVIPKLAEMAYEFGKDMQGLYSECVVIWFRSTHKMNVGFDNKDLVAYMRENHPESFDDKGKRINK